ncbi:15879_t:CDS:2, partial [Acaulospora morrowiae]
AIESSSHHISTEVNIDGDPKVAKSTTTFNNKQPAMPLLVLIGLIIGTT